MVTPQSVFGSGHAAVSAATQHAEHAQRLRAADALRRIARDETLKARAQSDPVLAPLLQRAAKRYIGGTNLAACIQTVKRINAHGHAATADYLGESTRDEARAANAARICAAAQAIGREVIISMEGSERTQAILDAHAKLCERFEHVGITVQARQYDALADVVGVP